jgi:hypothetical protein
VPHQKLTLRQDVPHPALIHESEIGAGLVAYGPLNEVLDFRLGERSLGNGQRTVHPRGDFRFPPFNFARHIGRRFQLGGIHRNALPVPGNRHLPLGIYL